MVSKTVTEPVHLPARQRPTDSAHQPHRRLVVARHRSHRPETRDPHESVGADGGRLEQHQIGVGDHRAPRPAMGTSTTSMSACSNRRTKPLPSPSVSTTRTSRSPRRGSASPIRSGQPSTQTVTSSGSTQRRAGRRRVHGDLVRRVPRLVVRVVRRQDTCRQPPQWTRHRVAIEDPATGGDEAGRIEAQTGKGAGRLPDEQFRRRARGAGHVPESLDRMRTAPTTLPRASGSWEGQNRPR